jgi:hypothetical protein
VWNIYADKAPALYGADPVNVETSVTYNIIFTDTPVDDVYLYFDEVVPITITAGNSSASTSNFTFEGDVVTSVSKNPEATSPSPGSYGTQTYLDGGIDNTCV